MKIKDIVAEGLLDPIRAWADKRSGQKEIDDLSKNVIGKWNQFLGRGGFKNVNNDLLHVWSQKFFQTQNIDPPKQGENANQYLTDLVRDYKLGILGQKPRASQASQTAKPSKKDMQVVVDHPREMTVSYQGQLYTTKGGDEPWTNTKTGKEVNPSFAKVLNQEYNKLVQAQNKPD